MTPANSKLWLSVRDIQFELDVSAGSAYRLVHERIPHTRIGGLIRVHRDDLERALRGDDAE